MMKGDAGRMGENPGTFPDGSGRNPREKGQGASNLTARREKPEPKQFLMMEAVVEPGNMLAALARVERNKGSAGIDDMPVEALRPYLREQWPRIKEELLSGQYWPKPVRRVEIPKPDGKGMRELGIPTVIDRLIQQAVHQVMQGVFDKGFSKSSYGFRPGRSAHQAVRQAREYVASGRRWIVDIDLEKFFDRVNHDVLMSHVAREVKDVRVMGLIRRYLQAGVMEGGVVSQSVQGTPQGGPLSPLLSNILLDDLDKEIEKRGHKFCRYADDCNVYVKSRRAGERVMSTLTRYLQQRLKLKINLEK
ncbi:MAG: group II intron reverse transcriptase/maturase, partial [Planctomycetota bacterium]